jgi:hypothetical protein
LLVVSIFQANEAQIGGSGQSDDWRCVAVHEFGAELDWECPSRLTYGEQTTAEPRARLQQLDGKAVSGQRTRSRKARNPCSDDGYVRSLYQARHPRS